MGDTEKINLSEFGWDNVCIPANLSNICQYLPKWNAIKILRDPQLHGRHEVYFPFNYFYDLSSVPYMPAIEKGDLHNDNGGYSSIFKAMRTIYRPEGDLSGVVRLARTKPFEEACIKEIVLHVEHQESEKEYIEEINSIMYEAYLHALINVTLKHAGLHGAVPNLYEVVALSTTGLPAKRPNEIDAIWMIMEFMNGCTLEKYLQQKFATGSKESNTVLLRDVLIQVANILQILQSKLLFNHRDLKLNNLYVREHSADWTQKINVTGIGEHICTLDIVMIDFGFSCIACGSGFVNPRATLLGAGSFFRSEHDCLKKGRDLAQLLYSLHCSYPLQNYVTRAFFDAIHGAMKAERRSTSARYDLFMGLDAVGTPLIYSTLPKSIKYNNGIYLFLQDNDIDVPGCEPSVFLRILSSCKR
jgi:serine/threonine protein kinase